MKLLILFCLALTSLKAQSALIITANDPDTLESTEDIGNMCSLGCGIGWDIKTTSTLASQEGNSYLARNLTDGYGATAWVEGARGNGIGETITFSFPKKYMQDLDSVRFYGFRLINGYAKDRRTWLMNGRVKTVRITYNKQIICDIEFHDSMGIQEAEFELLYIKPGSVVSVIILDVFPGSKSKDTAISELVPLGAH